MLTNLTLAAVSDGGMDANKEQFQTFQNAPGWIAMNSTLTRSRRCCSQHSPFLSTATGCSQHTSSFTVKKLFSAMENTSLPKAKPAFLFATPRHLGLLSLQFKVTAIAFAFLSFIPAIQPIWHYVFATRRGHPSKPQQANYGPSTHIPLEGRPSMPYETLSFGTAGPSYYDPSQMYDPSPKYGQRQTSLPKPYPIYP
jgi:hypothetical protein